MSNENKNESTQNMSCFVDCDSTSCVIRVPYELAVDMIWHLPKSEYRDRLLKVMRRASKRSNKFAGMLNKAFVR